MLKTILTTIKKTANEAMYWIGALKLTVASWGNFWIVTCRLWDGATVYGRVHFLITRQDGSIKYDCWAPNLVVTSGKNHVADQLSDRGEAVMSHMAIGTSTTAVITSDSALGIELDRNALVSKTQGSGVDANKVTYTCSWAAGDGTGAITEAGIFNSASAGQMLNRSVFAVKNKDAGESMTLTWILTISA